MATPSCWVMPMGSLVGPFRTACAIYYLRRLIFGVLLFCDGGGALRRGDLWLIRLSVSRGGVCVCAAVC